jgi:hypothetical protein
VNTDAHYERRTDRSVAEPTDPALNAAQASPLGVHGDPSRGPAPKTRPAATSQRSIAWVRPSELPTMVGAPWLRHGADLHAEMARRARRAPATAASRAGRRITRTAIGRPEPTSPTREGLSR